MAIFLFLLLISIGHAQPIDPHKLFTRSSTDVDTFINIFTDICIIYTPDYLLEIERASPPCEYSVLGDTSDISILFAEALNNAGGDSFLMFDYLDFFLCISQDTATGEHQLYTSA